MKKITLVLSAVMFVFSAGAQKNNKINPAGNKSLSPDVGAKKVIADYLKAIGGEEEIKKVKTAWIIVSQDVFGQTVTFNTKKMSPNKYNITGSSANGSLNFKQVFNGDSGYIVNNGNRTVLPEGEIKKMKNQAGNILVPELQYLLNPTITLENKGMEKLDVTDTYKIVVHLPDNVTRTEYYDINSKLLLRAVDSSAQATNTIDYSDYRKTGNLLLSYKNTSLNSSGNLGKTEQLFTSIKINEGVTENDFK